MESIFKPSSAALIEKLTRIRSMNLKNIIEHPKTINEAVNRLLVILTDIEKEQIKALTKDDLVLLHNNSFGKDIRNAFGLNDGNTALLGHRSADDVAMKIIEELWRRLQRRKAIRRIQL